MIKKGKQLKKTSIRLNSENLWVPLSQNFPNIYGITDQQIDQFYKKHKNNKLFEIFQVSQRDDYDEWLRNIKCYSRKDIVDLSKKMWNEWKRINQVKDIDLEKVAFVTSPRGGFEILGIFSYANDLPKEVFPYDFENSSTYIGEKKEDSSFLVAESLPYGKQHWPIYHIIYLDDVIMSGEQQIHAYDSLYSKLGALDVDPEKVEVKLHLMSLVGNAEKVYDDPDYKFKWNSTILGEEVYFSPSIKENVSGIVFPFSIPDGVENKLIRELYLFTEDPAHIPDTDDLMN